MIKFAIPFLVLVTSALAAVNDQIPAARKTTWTPGTHVGVIGGIPTNRTNIINVVTSYSADNTGVNSAHTAVQSAIDASSANDIIYLPAGTYKFTSAITFNRFQGNRTIRGAGQSTIINVSGSNAFINAGEAGGSNGYAYPTTNNTVAAGHASLEKGQDTITIADASIFVEGDLMLLKSVNDDAFPVFATPKYPSLRGQLVRLVTKSTNTLTFFPPLHYDASETNLAVYRNYDASDRQYVISGLGIEDMRVDATNTTATNPIITIQSAYNCWIKGVTVENFDNVGVALMQALNCEIRKSKIGPDNLAGDPNHQGLRMDDCGSVLIEDNIFYSVFPHIQVNDVSAGNVIAYNFVEQNESGGNMAAAINSNHDAHPHYNLYEGNVASVFQSDGYWGSNSHDTLFRNWFHATNYSPEDPLRETSTFGRAVWLGRGSRYINVVGNILGRTGETQVYSNAGAPGKAAGTSTTSNTIAGSGTKTWTTQSGLLIAGPSIGWEVKIWSDANPDNYMIGSVTSYSGTTMELSITDSNGSGTHTDWSWFAGRGFGYSDRFLLVLGMPNMGNGSTNGGIAEHSRGSAHTWSDWAAYLAAGNTAGPGPSGFQELDMDVATTLVLKGNYNYADAAIPSSESLGGDTLPPSLYRSEKPSWFGNLTWPAFDAAAPGSPAYTRIPAGYRYINGNENYLGSSPTFRPGKVRRLFR